MTITSCTIAGNMSSSDSTAFTIGGGIVNFGTMNVANSTISGNAAKGIVDNSFGGGGGIGNFGPS